MKRRAVAALLLVGVVGCRPAVQLSVSEGSPPEFIVRQQDGRACLRSLGVYRIADGQLAWRLGQQEHDACATRVRYGVVPPGYVQIGPPRALVASGHYRVAVTGPGYNDAAVFTAAGFRPPS